jgi:hypothetical protein
VKLCGIVRAWHSESLQAYGSFIMKDMRLSGYGHALFLLPVNSGKGTTLLLLYYISQLQ